MIGVALGSKHLINATKAKTQAQATLSFIKYASIVFLSALPAMGFNALITKEQKKASRVADMLAIKEMEDYKTGLQTELQSIKTKLPLLCDRLFKTE